MAIRLYTNLASLSYLENFTLFHLTNKYFSQTNLEQFLPHKLLPAVVQLFSRENANQGLIDELIYTVQYM